VRLTLERTFNSIWYQPNALKWLLWPLGGLFRVLAGFRRLLFRLGLKPTTTLPVPVIVVGNITVGGAGKTPFIIWLTNELKTRGYRVGIVSRGYGGDAEEWPQHVDGDSDAAKVGDEPVLLARTTGRPVAVGPNRVAAAQALLAANEIDLILSDDGLQHYALDRTAEIAVVDGDRGVGNGFSLPAGPLREPISRLDEVDAVVVNGGDWRREGAFAARVIAQPLQQVSGSLQKPLEDLRGTTVHAVAGISNPARFFELLESAGVDVIPHPLPDHAQVTAADLSFDDSLPVLITEKDAVKCRSFAGEDLWSLPIKFQLGPDDAELLMQLLLQRCKFATRNP
jgi:tetraacyldisaccharide 4'-kinase